MRPFIVGMLIVMASVCNAQKLLNSTMSLSLQQERLDHVLETISQKGNFFFSYNSNIIRRDSLVSGNFTDAAVKDILLQIVGPEFEFRETGNYIILRRLPVRIRLVTSAAITEDKFYHITGYVIDDQTGERIADASVYEKDRLQIAATNTKGYFSLKLKRKYPRATITVSKEYYEDTSVSIQPGYNQSVTITLIPMTINEKTVIVGPQGYQAPESIHLAVPLNDSASWLYRYVKADSQVVEQTALGKFFISSRQKFQTLNLRKFFVVRPYQVSLIPGLSTNGKLNSQAVNNFSFNIFGGYSGGTNGLEFGGLFNIDKRDARYVQIGGLFNVDGGDVDGFQLAGISNTVLNSVTGAQIGGITNYVNRKFSGFQTAGVYNHAGTDADGVQIAGVVNFTNHRTRGVQIAGVGNISSREVRGVQIGGVFNYTRRLRGVQIGLINVSDTSDGYSIGLVNIVFKGYHKLSLSTNEVINMNASFKTGNSKLYSIFLGGYNGASDNRVWSFGYGLGSEIIRGRKLGLNLEGTCQHLYLGSWDYYNLLNRASLQLNYKFGRYFSIFAGPVYSAYVSNQDVAFAGYKHNIPGTDYRSQKLGNTVTGWLGWTAGINIF